jgi:hypothetical protein
MATTSRKWAIGCGLGCGGVLLLVGFVGVAGYVFLREAVEEGQRIEAVMSEVRERHGAAADFTPAPDGTIAPDRLEAFLEVRELMAPARAEAEATLALLSGPEKPETSRAERLSGVLGRLLALGRGARTVQAGTELLPQIFAFVSSQADALLEADMGRGEYVYLYALVYYSWLQKSPADGPGFRLVTGEEDRGAETQDEFDVREGRREEILSRLNGLLLPMLRRQLAALDESTSAAARSLSPWHPALAAEIEAMEQDPYRLPWRDGLPAELEGSLQPLRGRLDTSYSALCNPMEVFLGTQG